MKYSLAIDIGASSGRHILGYIENGQLHTEEIYRFPNGVEKRGGNLVWNTQRLFEEILTGLRRAKEMGKVPQTVGIDTWAVDYALLDEKDRLMGDVVAYRDGRTSAVTEIVHEKIPFDVLYSRTGIQFQPFNTVYQLQCDKQSGKLDGARTFLMLPDYFHFLLTGQKRQEYTNATSTGMVNALTHDWDDDILQKLGYPRALFRKPTAPQSVVGRFTDDIAEQVGYSATVVLPATHDTASAVEGVHIEGDNPYISSGTWSLLGLKVKNALTDENSLRGNWSNEGGVGYFRYQKNIMGLWTVQSLQKELCPEKSFDVIVREAQQSKFNGVVDVNTPAFFAPESMKQAFDEAFFEAAERPTTTADYFRAAYIGLAHCYKKALSELSRNTGKTFDKLYIVGGGAKNAFLNKLTEDVCGIKVVALPVEATALGNLRSQLTALTKDEK